jgi:uncharacterized membrane protein YgaE (UPF0421/DUF939 family)
LLYAIIKCVRKLYSLRQIKRQTLRQTDRRQKREKQTERQRQRQTNRETQTEKHGQILLDTEKDRQKGT